MRNVLQKISSLPLSVGGWLKSLLFKESESEIHLKPQLNFKFIRLVGILGFVIFLIIVLILPDDPPAEFSEQIQSAATPNSVEQAKKNSSSDSPTAAKLWGSPEMQQRSGVKSESINYNTPMILGSSGTNAKTQLTTGMRISLRILDKTIISQDPVPVMVEVTNDAATESGLKLPRGTKLYGEANFEKGTARAKIHFTQASLPNGQIRQLSAQAISQDGQIGIAGRISSDAVKNTTGEMLTTFISSLASGSMETGLLGSSKGGIKNGLLSAVGHTAEGRAQSYGEKLKTEREWMELPNGMEFDALLNQSLDLQNNPSGGER
jgi:hypothetical protein